MDLFTIMKANIRHQKGGFFSVLILMMIVSMTLTAVITISINASQREGRALEEVGFGDLAAVLSVNGENHVDSIIQKILAVESVDKVKKIDILTGKIEKINGKKADERLLVEVYQPKDFHFQIYDKSGIEFLKNPPMLLEGEAYVPISYQSLYDCEIGDIFSLKGDIDKKEQKIKGFFEDPFMGSSMMGVKTILISSAEMERLSEQSLSKADGGQNGSTSNEAQIEGEVLVKAALLNVFQKAEGTKGDLEFQQELNKESQILDYAQLTLGKAQATGYMLIFVNIFSGILIFFSLLFFIVTLIVLSHGINSSIEMEYVNIGILKAVGFSQRRIKTVLVLQYLLGAVLGMILGMPLAGVVVKLVSHIMVPVTTLLASDHLALLPCILLMMGILVFIVIVICLKLIKIKKITPVRAICQGREEIYFSNRLQLPIYKRGMGFWLAFRSLLSNGKQYVSAMVISALLVFFLVMVCHMSVWVGEDGEGFLSLFNCWESDIEIQYLDKSIREEAENTMKKETEIESSYETDSEQLVLNDFQMFCYINDKPKEYNTVLKGRTCLYDNEILTTKFVAEDMGLNIGDEVTVSNRDWAETYIISGIYQCSNDMGNNFAMNKEGYERIKGNLDGYIEYRLKDSRGAKQIASELKERYGPRIKVETAGEINGVDAVVSSINGVTALAFVLTVIFVLVVIFMICGKIFSKEQQDYGIYKSVGFSSANLRIQFAVRFGIVALAGSILGIVLSVFLMDTCMGILLSLMGVSEIETVFSVPSLLIPMVFMTVLFFLFSYLIAGKIKRVQPRILIAE